MTGVGTSGPLSNDQSTCVLVTSPRAAGLQREHRPLARRRDDQVAVDDRRRDDAVVGIVGGVQPVDAPQLLAGREIVAGDDVAAGDDDLLGVADLAPAPGVVYESGDSECAFVGRSTRHVVLPVALSMRSRYDGSSVCMPCSTCT